MKYHTKIFIAITIFFLLQIQEIKTSKGYTSPIHGIQKQVNEIRQKNIVVPGLKQPEMKQSVESFVEGDIQKNIINQVNYVGGAAAAVSASHQADAYSKKALQYSHFETSSSSSSSSSSESSSSSSSQSLALSSPSISTKTTTLHYGSQKAFLQPIKVEEEKDIEIKQDEDDNIQTIQPSATTTMTTTTTTTTTSDDQNKNNISSGQVSIPVITNPTITNNASVQHFPQHKTDISSAGDGEQDTDCNKDDDDDDEDFNDNIHIQQIQPSTGVTTTTINASHQSSTNSTSPGLVQQLTLLPQVQGGNFLTHKKQIENVLQTFPVIKLPQLTSTQKSSSQYQTSQQIHHPQVQLSISPSISGSTSNNQYLTYSQKQKQISTQHPVLDQQSFTHLFSPSSTPQPQNNANYMIKQNRSITKTIYQHPSLIKQYMLTKVPFNKSIPPTPLVTQQDESTTNISSPTLSTSHNINIY